ncbi:uncharacterized protein BDR25DRAFT_349787 [Lindgomyces ingoldianus]|uniref:Uncharacterized protein n=1 Tax=Lindgomyces ingoldianus TaxID=673940 RepID=A0ACB6RBR1_9PLEO|nr:uncharacterized protein BDR25DRAFT_349787 [Lindgomyces ingoldianus]KAF2476728.1 hypothetical protein BDR25DRAFT_349787 [Lindgomyces ingoldianus]
MLSVGVIPSDLTKRSGEAVVVAEKYGDASAVHFTDSQLLRQVVFVAYLFSFGVRITKLFGFIKCVDEPVDSWASVVDDIDSMFHTHLDAVSSSGVGTQSDTLSANNLTRYESRKSFARHTELHLVNADFDVMTNHLSHLERSFGKCCDARNELAILDFYLLTICKVSLSFADARLNYVVFPESGYFFAQSRKVDTKSETAPSMIFTSFHEDFRILRCPFHLAVLGLDLRDLAYHTICVYYGKGHTVASVGVAGLETWGSEDSITSLQTSNFLVVWRKIEPLVKSYAGGEVEARLPGTEKRRIMKD